METIYNGWVSRHINRRISAPLAGLLARTPATPNQVSVGAFLIAIGSLAASHVYTSYGFIGVTADAVDTGSLTSAQVIDLMKEVTSMIEINVKALQRVRAGVGEQDREFLNELLQVYVLLQQEVDTLVTYARTKSTADGEAYESAREAAWLRIK